MQSTASDDSDTDSGMDTDVSTALHSNMSTTSDEESSDESWNRFRESVLPTDVFPTILQSKSHNYSSLM